MSEGTPIDALENGDIKDTADARAMQEIMQDMNLGDTPQAPPPQRMPPTLQVAPPPPPQQTMNMGYPGNPMHNAPSNYYVPMHDEPTRGAPKKNVWSSAVDMIRDPLVVALMFFALSLPVLHTFLGKYATWAYAVGGQLSWPGLAAFSAIAGIIFGLYRAITSLIGF